MKAVQVKATAEPPDDRCPHPRPFSPDFDGCPAFDPVGFAVVNALNRQIGEETTCRHLEMASRNAASSRFYAACSVGDAGARLRRADPPPRS